MVYRTINPANGQELGAFPYLSDDELKQKLELGYRAYREWKRTPLDDRLARIEALASNLISDKETLAHLISTEMGKPIKQSRAEIEKCALLCRYYVEKSPEFLSLSERESSSAKSYIRLDPVGLIYGVMPWNFPFWQVFRYVVPNLILGNGALLKHASNVPQCAMSIEQLILDAGFPKYVFQNLFIDYKQSDLVIKHRAVQGITLTGSEVAGAHVAGVAGSALKKTVLELGGSDPFIVLEDADLSEAVKAAVPARMQNTGQSCIASKRFIVHEKVYEAFRDMFAAEINKLKVGDPLNEDTDIGPLASAAMANELESQINRSLQKGARMVLGGQRLSPDSNYFTPGIMEDIHEDCPAWSEEVFGPLALLFKVKDADEAIRLANSSEFGLGACLFTSNPDHAMQLAAKIESGSVAINQMLASDPALPFGGVKKSGYGREMAEFGLQEFANIKVINLNR